MSRFDLSTAAGRLRTWLDYLWRDHAFLRFGFSNAHWLGPDLVRANQPSPGQLAYWRRRGVRTVVNLRGARDESFYALERDACERLGLTLIDAPLDSRDPPSADRVRRAAELFRTIAYPALIHCKSGADRAGLMAVLYRHLHLGEPVAVARTELGKRTLHSKEGLTGVLDYTLDRYEAEGVPQGLNFLQWAERPVYEPKAVRGAFKAGWWGTLLTERLLRRE